MTALGGCASMPRLDPIEHRVAGHGRLSIVFQSGLGDGLGVWREVQDSLATEATTLAFSRPGYGRSPAVGGERSPCSAAREQHALLRRTGLAPPYVLVGHSLGGLYQLAFARLYPHEVAAIVLVEPTHPEQWPRMQEQAPAMAAIVRAARLSPAFSATMRREFDDQQRCLSELAARATPQVPATVLVRARFAPPESGAFERLMRELWRDWPALVGTGTVTPVPGAGHYVQRDRPHAVTDAIRGALTMH